MPNNIAFARNYTSVIDEVYQRASVSGVLNSGRRMVRAGHNAKEILIPKISVTGLGNYTRNVGYKTGSITYEFETKTFNYDRGIKLLADVMDVEEAGVLDCFVAAGSELQRTQVATLLAPQFLLASLYPHPGDESKSQLFYEGKVLEALGLLVERTRASHRELCARLSEEDARRIRAVISYIDDHAAGNLLVPDLARAACMSPTKFKESFRIETGSTFTAYVQRRRVSMAESLLRQPDLTIAQVARAVGYTCSGRFSKIFQRETGMLPSEYRNTLARRP